MTKSNLATLIDQLGDLRAKQGELEREEQALKRALAEVGTGSYEGERYMLTVMMADRLMQDQELKDKIQELIDEHISRQFWKAHTEMKPIRTLRTRARNDKEAAG
jgi:hypothetical protein